jgi:hypothetical protein
VIVGAGVGDQRIGQIGEADAAVDVLVFLPKTPLELQTDLDGCGIGQVVDRHLHFGRHFGLDLAEDGERHGADAPVGTYRLRLAALVRVLVVDGDTFVVLVDRKDFRIVADQFAYFALERLGDHVHAADRLQHRGLVFVEIADTETAPKPGLHDIRKADRLRRLGKRHLATARIDLETAALAAVAAGNIGIVLVERAPAFQRFEQLLAVFGRDSLVEAALFRDFRKKLGDMAVKVCVDMAIALRLAAKRLGRMQLGVVVDLHESLELDAEPLAVSEHRMVVVWDAPRAGIEIKALVEFALLFEAAEFGVFVAAAQRPAAAAGFLAVLQDLNLVARLAEFVGGDHAGKPGAKDKHGSTFRVAVELDRPLVGRLLRKTEGCHGLVHGCTSSKRADHGKEIAAAEVGSSGKHRRTPSGREPGEHSQAPTSGQEVRSAIAMGQLIGRPSWQTDDQEGHQGCV